MELVPCQRCGEGSTAKFFYIAVTEFDQINDKRYSRLCADLCFDCYQKLKKFLKNYRDN